MNHVAVIALTYRRQDGLKKLIDSLQVQRAAAHPFRLTVVVVDNDAARSAEAVATAYVSRPDFTVQYEVQPVQGIPHARNAGLDAVPADADFLCFIDDDEFAAP